MVLHPDAPSMTSAAVHIAIGIAGKQCSILKGARHFFKLCSFPAGSILKPNYNASCVDTYTVYKLNACYVATP